jgi:hypothetical protein
MRFGMNVSRQVVGGTTTNQIDVRDQYTSGGSPPTLQKAVVVDVIYDYSIMTDEYKQNLFERVGNFELIEVVPINSIVAKIISNQEGLNSNQLTILFPFFSSHFMLPVQVGEVVHVIYQDYLEQGNKLGFWLSRIHGTRQAEDPNYTHIDRQFDPINDLAKWSTNNLKLTVDQPEPNFPNGGDTPDTYTLSPSQTNQNPYDTILESSLAASLQTQEVVPRWNKRPQELVVQGANNAMICLGEDRSGGVVIDESDEDMADSKGYAGTIDMVVGRGRFFPLSKDETPELTAPRTITNTRNYLETDKAPHRQLDPNGGRLKDNSREGDPDFTNDAARIYVTMRSAADNKFGITGIRFPSATLPIEQPPASGENIVRNRSYVIGKADHIRLIARKHKEEGIEGSLLFLREGDASDNSDGDKDLSYLLIDKNGINIESKKIFLGTSAHENPNESSGINYNDDNGPYEPYILWSKYQDTINNLHQQINDLREKHEKAIKELRDTTANYFDLLSNVMAGGGNSIPYGPNSAIAAAAGVASAGSTAISIASELVLNDVVGSLSNLQDTNNTENVSKINHSQVIYGTKGQEE